MPRRRRPRALSSGRRILSAAALVAAGLPVASAMPALAASGAVPVVFASPTVVSEFAPGYEPDVVADTSSTPLHGNVYVSWPNGFSTTTSYLYRSNDGTASFHPVEAQAAGKPFTCVGGGDSELQLNRHDGQLLFNDLQGLTNFSTSVSSDGGKSFSTQCVAVKGTGVDRQWVAIDDNGGTSSIGSGATDGRAYLFYDNVAQNLPSTGNAPVVNASTDGLNFGGCADAGATACNGPAVQFSAQDDIVGNAFVDGNPTSPRYHTVYEVRGSSDSTKVLLSSCRGAPVGTATTAAATAGACVSSASAVAGGGVSTAWTDHTVATLPAGSHEKSFVVGAVDSAGNLYVVWAQYPYAADGVTVTGDGTIRMATSRDGGATWSAPVVLNPPAQHTVIFPWIAVGDPGRADVVWYGAPQAQDNGLRGPDGISNGTWNVYLANSTNALDPSPAFQVSTVSDHVNKFGNISTGGLGGTQDRSLGDFLQVKPGVNGEALVSYVDDTSGNRNNDITAGSGQTPPEAAGPTMVARQIGGPSLYSSAGSLSGGVPAVGSVTDPTGVGYPDAYLSLGGSDTSASPALDIAAVSVTRADATHLQVVLRTADPKLAADLAPSPAMGGLFANWNVRWAGRYGTAGPDGQIYYVGLQAGQDGVPQFYAGATASIDSTRTKYFAYPTTTTVPGRITGDTITWTVPLAAIGSPAQGDGLYSVTGFTSTQATPNTQVVTTLPTGGQVGNVASPIANLIDAAPSFSYTVGAVPPATTAASGTATAPVGAGASSGPAGTTTAAYGGSLAYTGLGAGLPAAGLLLVVTAAAARRRRSRRG